MIFSLQKPSRKTQLIVGSDYSSSMDCYISVYVNDQDVLSFYNNESKMYSVPVEVGDKISAHGDDPTGSVEGREYRGLSGATVDGASITGTAQRNPYILFT